MEQVLLSQWVDGWGDCCSADNGGFVNGMAVQVDGAFNLVACRLWSFGGLSDLFCSGDDDGWLFEVVVAPVWFDKE